MKLTLKESLVCIVVTLILLFLLTGCRNRITLESDAFYESENDGNVYKSRQAGGGYTVGNLK